MSWGVACAIDRFHDKFGLKIEDFCDLGGVTRLIVDENTWEAATICSGKIDYGGVIRVVAAKL
jgi:hypothetical protein